MDQFGDELKKVFKAGLGAVAAGLEKGQDALENLAQKGEPIYQQAKSAVTDAAGKVAQAVSDGIQAISSKPSAQDVIDLIRTMSREDWAQIRAALDEFEALADENDEAARDAAQAAQEILDSEAAKEEAPEAAEDAPAPEEAEPENKEE